MVMALGVVLGFCLLAVIYVYGSYARAKYKAFRTGVLRVPIWAGFAELILWEPGETVVLLKNKRMIPMSDPAGGYRVISALRGEEYKGRINYKTNFLTYTSDPILTSDGLSVNLALGIWWKIQDSNLYLSKISSDYHAGQRHFDQGLAEAAEYWIKSLAGGTLRENINKLPTEKLISPYVQAYIQVAEGKSEQPLPQFSDLLDQARQQLNEKTARYGIEVERIEVQELRLPEAYQSKLEAVRVAFLKPYKAKADTSAQVIALEGLASVIGREKVGLIEILKHIDFPKTVMQPTLVSPAVAPLLQPIANAVQQQAERALSPKESDANKQLSAAAEETEGNLSPQLPTSRE